jgi:hypothetical protein
VDVGGSIAQRLGDDLAHELDDRGIVGGVDDCVGRLLCSRRVPELLDLAIVSREQAVVGVQRRDHVLGRGEVHVDRRDRERGKGFAHVGARAVGDGNIEYVAKQPQRHDAEPASDVLWDDCEGLGCRPLLAQVDGGQPELRCQGPREGAGAEQALFDQDRAQLPTRLHLQVECARQLLGQQRVFGQQDIAEARPSANRDHRCDERCRGLGRLRWRVLATDLHA